MYKSYYLWNGLTTIESHNQLATFELVQLEMHIRHDGHDTLHTTQRQSTAKKVSDRWRQSYSSDI